MSRHKEQDHIEKTVELAAPVARVWRALTDHEEFGSWFQVQLDAPFQVGERTTGKITYPGHEHVEWISTTEQMDHERLFAFSWPPSAVDPETRYGPEARMLVEFRLEEVGKGTRLVIKESGFQQFPEAKRLDVLNSCSDGWGIQAKNIAAHVER